MIRQIYKGYIFELYGEDEKELVEEVAVPAVSLNGHEMPHYTGDHLNVSFEDLFDEILDTIRDSRATGGVSGPVDLKNHKGPWGIPANGHFNVTLGDKKITNIKGYKQ